MSTVMLSSRLVYALGLVVLFALPALFITTNIRIAFQSQTLYTYAIDAFDAPERTGIEREELIKGMAGIIAYFESDEDLITTAIVVNGISEPLFTEPEALHFRDVRDLLRLAYTVQAVATVLMLAAVLAAIIAAARGRPDNAIHIFKRTRQSALWTVIALIGIGLFAALGGFNFLFLQFHLLSFSNDLWQGTADDRMIQLFPEAFFLQATLFIGLATIIEMGIVWTAATVSLRGIGSSSEAEHIAGELSV